MPPKPLTTIYKEINGTKITTDIYLPENAPHHEKYPVLITIHGGAFMLGHSSLISLPQVDDCLARGWIVVAPNHRLCPQVNIAEGPVRDCRDFLEWVYADEGLDGFLSEVSSSSTGSGVESGSGPEEGNGKSKRVWQVDKEKVMAMGTSSGGFLALALGYDTPRPPRAILNFYGAVHFTHTFWTQPLPHVQKTLPPLDPEFIRQVYSEVPVPIQSGISLEGQTQSQSQGQTQTPPSPGPNPKSPRDLFALTQIANGTVLSTCLSSSSSSSTPSPLSEEEIRTIDPVYRIHPTFPPTCIIHGTADRMVPAFLSKELLSRLQEEEVRCEMVDVEGEDHTFAMGMKVGSRTWEVQRRGFEFLEEVIRGV
ncbi:uncharacterized protein KD926_003319 [Aspergillus affinis]|uniref:uncharacterized protein n=1 Tax=Aspergillus affinis TaxID=1070780 RepID=UPI0022FDDE0C|nr:alpha/beta-hydrolase [Aspergillus affinis]KAI9043549.1 alpha/beta-hydrolase [Aspergillus affinis]